MGTLYDLAQEYRANDLALEQRLVDLRNHLSAETSNEVCRIIRHRINVLEKMLADNRYYIDIMEHYYDKE